MPNLFPRTSPITCGDGRIVCRRRHRRPRDALLLPSGRRGVRARDGYSRLWLPCYSSWAEFGNDTLRVDVGGERIRIAGAELLARQLARVGVASCEELRDSREHIESLMDYRDARCRIIFSDLSLERTDSLGWRIAGAQLRAVMLR